MILRTDPKYPNRRAYVLKLRSEATSSALLGRIENLVTGERCQFTSALELIELIERDIANAGAHDNH
jgi:hypothetical protein